MSPAKREGFLLKSKEQTYIPEFKNQIRRDLL